MQRIEAFLMETEDDADMTAPGWEAAFSVRMVLRHRRRPHRRPRLQDAAVVVLSSAQQLLLKSFKSFETF